MPMRREGQAHKLGGEPPFDWREIQAVLDGEVDVSRFLGRVPKEAPRPCEFCGARTNWIAWSNSMELWKALCGRAGYVEVCLDCRAWYPAKIQAYS